MRLEPGTVIERWTVLHMLGRGGMAVVYLARHNQLGSLHAIKLLTTPTPAVQARLLQEGRAQSSFRHSNVVAVTDLVQIGGSTGLVMEFVEGPSLHRLLRAHLLDLSHTDVLARGILQGVAAAHAHGLVHRDLKPANILVAIEDRRLVPKITDFGLTKILGTDHSGSSSNTHAGLPMGTPSYMAPEQTRDASGVDQRADIFALGAILYELVCGQRAFLGEDVVDTYTLIRRGVYRDPLELRPDVPDRMVTAIRGALQIAREARTPTVSALLEQWRGGPQITDQPVERWPDLLLQDIRALGQEHTRSSPPEAPAHTPPHSSETWADLDISPAPSVTRPAPSASRPPIRAAVLAVMVLFALGTALAIFATRQEPDAEILGPDRQVEIHGDPVVQREFDAGWEALLEADFDRAVRRLGVVVAREPDHPLPWLVYWYALLQADRRAESLSAFWAAVERAEDRRGASAKLTQALANVRRHGWSGAEQEVQDHLVRHPEDFFARVAAFAVVPMTEELQAQALLAEARTIEPQPALLAYLEGSRALVQEDFRQAERVVQEGLATHPRSPTLLALQGEVLLKRGAFERARDALTDALNEDPGMHIARTRLSGAHLMLDDREAADAITEQMMEPTTRWDHQVRYATSVSEILIGLGRYHEATALLHRAEAIAAEHNAWLSVITLRGAEALYHLAGDDTESMSAATQKLIDISHNPEIPDAERENLVRNLLYAQGMATARRGEIEDALRILGRLRQLDRVWPQYLEYLEREIAVARRDVDAIAGLMSSIPETCVGDLERGHYLWLAGRPDLAAPWIRPRLAAPEDCSAVGETRLRFADSHLILSELALQEGDTETAETHLQAFEALWPTPDADLPITRRHAALRTEGIDLTP